VAQWDAADLETIDAVFDRAVQSSAAHPFLDFSGEHLTYGQVAQRVARTATMLR
jgi:acyl-CoA synthetase (AMP-forming)/AMP-acid ligase II